MGIRALRLLRKYWGRLKMLAWAGGYYIAPFRGERGVTQVKPLLPTIFNVVVYTLFRHWESLRVAEREELEGRESSGDKGDGARRT